MNIEGAVGGEVGILSGWAVWGGLGHWAEKTCFSDFLLSHLILVSAYLFSIVNTISNIKLVITSQIIIRLDHNL